MTPEIAKLFAKAISLLQALFAARQSTLDAPKPPLNAPPSPVTPPKPPLPQPTKLHDFCLAIRDYEGKPGDRNYKNNNPGNARYSSVGYDPMYGTVRKDKDGFAIFATYSLGFLYLTNLVRAYCLKQPEWNIQMFFSQYAPASDNNQPIAYAKFVASRVGVSPETFKLKQLL